jgi:hypothetical protein
MDSLKELGGILSTSQLYQLLSEEKFLNKVEIGRLINTIEKCFELWKNNSLDDANASVLDEEAIECSMDNISFAQLCNSNSILILSKINQKLSTEFIPCTKQKNYHP